MSYFRQLEHALAAWVDARAAGFALSARQLAGVRIGYGLFALLCYLPHFAWLAVLPRELFAPLRLSLTSLLADYPSAGVLLALDCALPLALLALTLGIRARISGALAGALLLAGWSLETAVGKVDHYALLALVPLVMALSDWGRTWAVLPDPPARYARLALPLLATLIAFAMASAGLGKLRVWVDFDTGTSGFLDWFYSGYFRFGRRPVLGALVLALPAWTLEVMDYVAVVFELAGVVCLAVSARVFRWYLLVAVLFHLSTSLLLGIYFFQHVPVYAAFLVAPVLARGRAREKLPRSVRFACGVAVVAAIAHVALRVAQHPRTFLPVGELAPDDPILVGVGVALWATMLLVGVVGLTRGRS